MRDSEKALERLTTARRLLGRLLAEPGCGPSLLGQRLAQTARACRENFFAAMDDDFNTALAISYLFSLGKEINIYAKQVEEQREKPDGKALYSTAADFAVMTGIIGVLETKEQVADKTRDVLEIIARLRQEARQRKDYAAADAIRDALGAAGVVLEDTAQGVRWKFK
jgi:cysteinyl-tRNA synthetase